MLPNNRFEFIDYCKRRLGAGALKVNITDEQADDRVDEALYRFHERHYHGSQEVFVMMRITELDCRLGYMRMPPDMVSVINVLLPTPNMGIFSVEYQLQLENLFSTSLVSNYGDLTYYTMTQSNITLINRLFSPQRQYTFNPLTHRLHIAGGLRNTKFIAGGIVVRGFKKVFGDKKDAMLGVTEHEAKMPKSNATGADVGGAIIENIWQDRWLQNYTAALLKLQWGHNLGKFQNVQLLNGTMMNGKELKDEAKEEIKELEDELYSAYELPPMPTMA